MLLVDLGEELETSIGANLHNVTVSAIRMDMWMSFATTAVVGDRVRMAYGIMWIAQDSFDIGGTSVPDPSTDHVDWIAHGSSEIICDAAAVLSSPRNGLVRIRNDSMRKQRENNSVLALIVRATVLMDPVTIFFSGRTLFIFP